MSDDRLAAVESAFLTARDLVDRQHINEARGEVDPGLDGRVAVALAAARTASDGYRDTPADPADARAARIVREWLDAHAPGASGSSHDSSEGDAGTVTTAAAVELTDADESWAATAERGFEALSARIEASYATAQGAVSVTGATLTRLGVLERLATEPDPAVRRRLFYALEPVWQTIDGDGSAATSPYQRLLIYSATRWAGGLSPVDRNATALGMTAAGIEAQLVAILTTWRETCGGTPIEPWDWWYAGGTAARALRTAAPIHRIRQISDRFHASLGADPAELGVGFDVFPRPGRPLVPVAFTEFGGRPHRGPDGVLRRAKAWVMGTYTAGGLGELTELVHETGHAIHVAAIDARPAFADWPDSDAFTEALAELTGMDTAEPAWQEHWLGVSVPEAVSLRGRYADIMLDVCWALLEIRLHADPERAPNDVWAELTSTYLGIVGHPELSWWAMRGQLVQEPGYMVNYAIGPIITADLRAAIRAARGDWSTGDSGWYEWVSARVYRYGLARGCADVLADVLGRAPGADALVTDIARARPA